MDEILMLPSADEARPGGLAFDLSAIKLLPPSVRQGSVLRSRLIERLVRPDSGPVISVVASAGYGKTTLLAQWAERSGLSVAWVSVDEADNDPKVLLAYVAEALNAVEPISGRVFDALASPVSSVPGSVVPRLGNALASMTSPVALVLDDVHLLHNSECRAALSVLADHVRDGSRLVLAGRYEPPLRVARLRAEGRITEIGPGDLSLSPGEASALLAAAEVAADQDEVAELYRRTEGWAAALYLAALSLRAGGTVSGAVASFAGSDRLVSEYVESELLVRISPRQRLFLTRTAVLERLSGPLCEAVLELPRSAAELAGLARWNQLVVPLDRRGQWYRYHHLFRDMLFAELEHSEPGLIPVLRRRAAAWHVANDLPETALDYSMAAGDVDQAARLIQRLMLATYRQGRLTTLQRWFEWLDAQGGLRTYPRVAALAAEVAAATGRPTEAERWADAVDRWQGQDPARSPDPVAAAWAADMRAVLCRHGIEQMRADAEEAARRWAEASIVALGPPFVQGIERVLTGDLDGGDALFEEAIRNRESGAPDIVAAVLCERSMAALTRRQWNQAEALANDATAVLQKAGMEDCYVSPLLNAVHARLALHRGDVPAARRELLSAQRLRGLLTYAFPYLAVQARIELTRSHLALADLAGARMLMREIEEILKRRPGLGTLVGEAETLRAQLSKQRSRIVPGPSALTAAELRLLPMLATHLQMQEIAAEMYLSPHTVRAQAKSVYRKLGATSRGQAVALARELGLLEG